MKTVLVYPYAKRYFTGCNPPLSLLYLAASLRKEGNEVKVIDIDEDNLTYNEILKSLINFNPQLIGIPLFSYNLNEAYDFVNLLKTTDKRWKILIGGPHATACPEYVINRYNCDFVLRGESEKSICNLASCLEKNSSFETVYGLTYKTNGVIVNNPNSVPIPNLDGIPFPARDLLETAYLKNTYWRMGHRGTTDIMITSRGCPFNCNFCFKVEKKFRYRSPENVLEELDSLRSKGIRNVHFMDEIFVVPKARCLQILKLIKEEKFKMKFKVRARVDLIDEELLATMKEAGVIAVVYGIESGSQKMLNLMNKKTTVSLNQNAIKLTKKAGLQCYADILIGYPGETRETIFETERFLLNAKPTAIKISPMHPFPCTQAYNKAKNDKTLIGDWDINNDSPWIKLPWTKDFRTLSLYSKRIHRKYLLRPEVFFNSLKYTVFKMDFRQLKTLLLYLKAYIL